MKVELIAALLHKPKVIFLDEPTIGLDLSAQKAVRSFIKEYRKEHKPTVILTSHYMDDIEELCPRICILRAGKKVYDGGLKELHNQYADSKLITANLVNHTDIEALQTAFPTSLGEILIDESIVKIRSPRDKIMEASKFLLNQCQISDFNISEEEVGTIIENILSHEGGH